MVVICRSLHSLLLMTIISHCPLWNYQIVSLNTNFRELQIVDLSVSATRFSNLACQKDCGWLCRTSERERESRMRIFNGSVFS